MCFVPIFIRFVMFFEAYATAKRHMNLSLSVSEKLLRTTGISTRKAKRPSSEKLYRVYNNVILYGVYNFSKGEKLKR